jgi:peroxiredoxin
VSTDTQDTSDRFRTSLLLPFPLVGDPDGAILKAYRVRWPIIGLAKRMTYVVSRDRTILSAFRSERHMTAHAGHACKIVREQSRNDT